MCVLFNLYTFIIFYTKIIIIFIIVRTFFGPECQLYSTLIGGAGGIKIKNTELQKTKKKIKKTVFLFMVGHW